MKMVTHNGQANDFDKIKAGIIFDDILLMPTFNKIPIKANTSFNAPPHGIINSTLDRYKTLSTQELETIRGMTDELYRDVSKRAFCL